MDYNNLKEQVKEILLAAATGVVEGARKDLELLAGELAGDLTVALMAGDRAMLDVTVARIKLLGERQRLQLNAHAMGVLAAVARALFAFAKEVILP